MKISFCYQVSEENENPFLVFKFSIKELNTLLGINCVNKGILWLLSNFYTRKPSS